MFCSRAQDYASLRELCTDEDLPGWSFFDKRMPIHGFWQFILAADGRKPVNHMYLECIMCQTTY